MNWKSFVKTERHINYFKSIIGGVNRHFAHIVLLDVNALTSSEITKMIDSGDAVIRKYGIIAATKLYKRYLQIVNEAANAQNLDVREFSKIVVGTKNKSDWLINDEK